MENNSNNGFAAHALNFRKKIRLGPTFMSDLEYHIRRGTVASAYLDLFRYILHLFGFANGDPYEKGRVFNTTTFVAHEMVDKVFVRVSAADATKLLDGFENLKNEIGYTCAEDLREKLYETEDRLAMSDVLRRQHDARVAHKPLKISQPQTSAGLVNLNRKDHKPIRKSETISDQLSRLLDQGKIVRVVGGPFVARKGGSVYFRLNSPEGRRVNRGQLFTTACKAESAGFEPSTSVLNYSRRVITA